MPANRWLNYPFGVLSVCSDNPLVLNLSVAKFESVRRKVMHYASSRSHFGLPFGHAEEERKAGYKKKDFKQAKFDFVDEMYKWSRAEDPKSMLDVGCGIGGTSRHLAAKRSGMKVEGEQHSMMQLSFFDPNPCQ